MRLRLLVPLLFSGTNADVSYQNGITAYSPVAAYDWSIPSLLWQDDGRTTPVVANADVIGAVDDFSGNGYHLTQATAANKPTYRTNVLNGKSVARLDGSNDSWSNTAFADFSDTYTVYVVMAYALAGAGDATQGVFDVNNGSLNTGFAMYHEATAKANARAAGGPVTADSTADLRDGTFRVHSVTNIGTQLQYRRNNGTAQTIAYTAPNPNTLSRLDVGKFGQLSNYILNGDLAALLIFNTNHDATTRAAIHTILYNRYGINP